MFFSRVPFVLGLSVLSTSIYAVDQGIAPLGFTGALSTPSAAVLPVGTAALAFSPYLDGQGIQVDGYNYLAGAGLGLGVEMFGRLATNTVAAHCYEEYCGLRDLSASMKVQIPNLALLMGPSTPAWWPQVAVGATDVGGAATNFRSYYGVATWDQAWWALSMGWADTPSTAQRHARLDGAFASVVVQPLPWLQGVIEHDGTAAQAGLRLISLPQMLPAAIRVSAEVRSGAPRAVGDTRALWWGVSARIPLGGVVGKPVIIPSLGRSQTPDPLNAAIPITSEQSTPIPPLLPQNSAITVQARQLADRLSQAGFLDVRVGYGQARWIVAVENQAYQRHSLDALGVALGEFHQWAGSSNDSITFILEQEGQQVLTLDSDNACLTAWLEHGERCAAGVLREINQPATLQGWTASSLLAPDTRPWLIRGQHPSLWRPRVEFAPVLNYAVGTEYGSLDYSLGVASTLDIPVLWSGLLAEWRYISPLTHSKDYRDAGVFADSALKQGLDRALLHQYVQTPWGWSGHVAAGRLFDDYDGGFAEGRWQSASGAHKWSMLLGDFTQQSSHINARPVVAGYRYQLPHQDIQLGIKAGQFFDGDRGYWLSSRFAFGDTFLSLFYRSTKTSHESHAQHYAGVQLSLPLTPRRNRPTAYGQLRGTPEYTQSIQTEVGDELNAVAGSSQRGRFASAPRSLDTQLYGRDRLSVNELNRHLDRLRQAYLQYVTRP
jgi:hypothetical protein